MKEITSLIFILLITVSVNFAQTLSVQVNDPPIPLGITNSDWSNGDFVVSSTQPFGKPHGIYRTSNSSIYVAIPDTNIGTGHCIALLRSSNNGASWVAASYISPATTAISKVKMVDAGADSLYCFFLYGTSVYCWNIVNGRLNTFTAYTNIRDFDAVASGTHALHLIIDLIGNNDVRQYGSTNGGQTWPVSQYISSAGAIPRIAFNSTGDSCILNYFASITADTGSSLIRNFRFRESAPGTLTSLGYTDVIAAGTFKDQFQPVLYKGKAWLFYTTGTTGNINLNCIQSDNGGSSYGSPFTIGALPSRDEYWFDAKYFTYGSGGVDLIYYSDSVSGTPSNITDRLYYTYINYTTPTAYGTPVQFSQHWPFWSSRLFIPSIIEYYNTIGDMGAIWVGGPTPYKLYWDGYNLTTRVTNNQSETPNEYSLSQNYPNPFNPVTKIDFSIPKNGLVTIKIYDILGKEVDVLVNKEFSAGVYSIDYDASKLSSGIYFYKITAGDFSKTKKMMLIK
jgi:hypothetical protein